MSLRNPPEGEGRLIQLAYHAYMGASWIARSLPEPAAYRLAEGAGWLKSFLTARQARQAARNLARIVGRPPGSRRVKRLVRDAYRSYGRYWLETFRIVQEDQPFFLDRFRCHGEHHIDEVMARTGKGAIVVVGHLGNYDAAGGWVASTGRSLVTVAEVIKPRRLYEFFVDHRAKLGMTIYPAERGVTEKLIAALEEGAVVALLGDRDIKGTGVEVELFGEPTTLPGGAASISVRTGVPVLVAGVYGEVFEGGKRGWSAEISEPIEPPPPGGGAVAEMTRRIAARLEIYIERRPEEWHVFAPFWIADRRRA